MQKDIKTLDKELSLLHLQRIPDSATKSVSSLFRSLSNSIFLTPNESQNIVSILKCTLLCNVDDRKANPFPVIPENSQFFRKYLQNKQIVLEMWNSPQLSCFEKDWLEIASIAFQKKILLYWIDSEGYLNESIISSSKNNPKNKIMLAKTANNKYFSVQRSSTVSLISFIKQSMISSMISSVLNSSLPPAVHFPIYDQSEPKQSRRHKKSLSDCGEILNLDNFNERNAEQINRGFVHTHMHAHINNHMHNNHPIFDRMDEEFDRPIDTAVSLSAHTQFYCEQPQMEAQISQFHQYQYYDNTFQPIANQRYTGRLKFFDLGGNFGFLVMDTFNLDLFVHFDDLSRAGVTKEMLSNIRNLQMRFQFTYFEYDGKQKKAKSKKAVDLRMIIEGV